MLFLAVYLAILRPVKKQVVTAFRELPARITTKAAKHGTDQLIEAEGSLDLGSGGQRVLGLKKQLAERVKGEPAAATKLVQSWIRETAR